MFQGKYSAIHLTLIKLSFVIKTFVLSIFEWPLKFLLYVSFSFIFGPSWLSGRVLDLRLRGSGSIHVVF